MANDYVGPHKVILVKRSQNLGLIAHLNELFERADGDVIVLAAGDDISLPRRVEKLVNAFVSDEKALLVHSDAIAIDQAGIPGALESPPALRNDASLASIATASAIYIGATGAVRRELIAKFGLISEKKAFEDLVMGFRATLLGGMRYLAEPLVYYRTGIGLSSHGARQKSFPDLRLHHAEIMLATLRQRYADLLGTQCPDRERLENLLQQEMSFFERIRAFHDPALAGSRASYARKMLRYGLTGVTEAFRHARFALRQRLKS